MNLSKSCLDVVLGTLLEQDFGQDELQKSFPTLSFL